jgi:hypothetical protein
MADADRQLQATVAKSHHGLNPGKGIRDRPPLADLGSTLQ